MFKTFLFEYSYEGLVLNKFAFYFHPFFEGVNTALKVLILYLRREIFVVSSPRMNAQLWACHSRERGSSTGCQFSVVCSQLF